MRVGIYASMRDEERNLPDWLATVGDADCVAVNDTGSADDTFPLLSAANVRAERLPVEPMELSNALNIALALLPGDIDLAIRLDADERLRGGWRDELERVWAQRATDLPTLVWVWFDHRGCVYRHSRIHGRHGFHWDLPVHEVLADNDGHTVTRGTPYGTEHLDADITFDHFQDLAKDRSGVLDELIAARAAEPDNPRHVHYLAREYTYRGDWQSAIPLFRQHVESWDFPEQRSESWRLLGDCYVALMDPVDVPVRPYAEARRLAPERREPWVALAELHHTKGNWASCRYYAERALEITEKNWHFNDPAAWGARPYDLAALACWFLGDAELAVEYGELAVEIAPDDPRLVDNLRWYMGQELADAIR